MTDLFTPEFIRAQLEIAAAATERPWEVARDCSGLPCVDPNVVHYQGANPWVVGYEDAAYIVAACDEDRLLLEGRVLPYARQYAHLLDGGSVRAVRFVGASQ